MAITDKFNNTKTTVNPVVTTVSTARSIGVTSLVCTDLTGWPTTVHFVTYKKTVTGAIDKTTQCEWKGIVSGSTIGTLTLKSGSDAGNAVGDFVEMGPTASWGKDLIDGITTQHNQDGTHAAVTATSVTTTGAVTAGNGLTVTAGTVTAPTSSLTGLGGAWTSFTPTWTNLTVGNGTVTAKYIQIGKTIHFQARVLFGSTTSVSSITRLTLPVTSVSYGTNYATTLGKATFWDDSAAVIYYGATAWVNTTTIEAVIIRSDTVNTQAAGTSSTNPFTWTTSDILSVQGTYEAA